MSVIQVMPAHLSNMIAAGEVVDRPVNIVKECVENSLDAGATRIQIEVEEGGISGITITDDGCGMDFDDALLAFSRHATSKLFQEEDLFNIQTMGFRGEALASIGAVAKVDLYTNNGETSTHIQYAYGECIIQEEYECPRGTKIEIRGLFIHTPARLKYLKKANYEFSIIADTVNKLAITHPEIRFSLSHDHRMVFQTSGNGSIKEIIYQMFGREVAMNAMEFSAAADDFEISGLAVQPKISRSNKRFIYLSVNDRIIRSYPITNAIVEAYREFLPRDRYPIVIMNVAVDTQLVDVNVHPNKTEVRMTKEEYLGALIINTIENLFSDQLQTPGIKAEKFEVPYQDPLELHYPLRSETKDAISKKTDSETEAKRALRSNQHFQGYEARNGQKYDEPDHEQSVKKELREQFGGIVPVSFHEKDGSKTASQIASRIEKEDRDCLPSMNSFSEINPTQPVAGNISDTTQKNRHAISDNEHHASVSSSENAQEGLKGSGIHSSDAALQIRTDQKTEDGTERKEEENSVPLMKEEQQQEMEQMLNQKVAEEEQGKEFFSHLRIIGQLRRSYILCEGPSGLVIIDQHAAQERYNFERLENLFEQGPKMMQPRMVPLRFTVDSAMAASLGMINEYTVPYGLNFESFGSNELILRQEPEWANLVNLEAFIQDLLSYFKEHQKIDMKKLRRHMIATMACHSSVRFNHELNMEEMEKVVSDLQKCRQPYHCPHGRPTVITLSDAALRKEFERG